MQRIELVYVRPLGDHRMFEARLGEAVRHFGDRVEITTRTASELSELGVFSSETLPTVVLVRDGEVVAHAIGDLPLHELEALLRTS